MTKRIKVRTLLLGGLLTLLFLGLFGRIYWVQVAHASFWADQARQTWITSKPLPQERGTITDRNGKVLAADTDAYTVAVSPKIINQLNSEHPEWRLLDQIVSKIHLVLNKPENEVRDAINAKKKDGTFYDQRELNPEGWKIDKEVAQHLMTFRDELEKQTNENDIGLYFEEGQKRYYPNQSLASQILGYVDKDGKAVMGVEKTMNADLQGQAGKITYEKDGIRTQLPNGTVDVKQPVDGKNVELTIDKDIQFYMEQALRDAYDKYHPVSATAIAADPKTMDILGMVSLPDFNPNSYWSYKPDSFKNDAIQSVYEPGSTFKIVTLAAAIQEGKFDPNATYKSGNIHVPGATIRDSNNVGWGTISYLDGLKHSSNVAFVHLGYEMLGKDKLRQYIDNFGFGQKTGIELAGEVSGAITFQYPSEVATAAFGQGKVQVTPIQQVAAVAAVANGGRLMEPHLIRSVTDPKTGEKTVTQPKAIRQVISADTSRQAGDYLEQVVSDQKIGTGRTAYIPGYRIAGKTGTAQVVINGEYSKDKYVVSFIGYAPVEDPKIVLYILIDQPDVPDAGGGAVAGPVFKSIMQQSLLHLGVLPKLDENTKSDDKKQEDDASATPAPVTASVPDVSGKAVDAAKAELTGKSFGVEVIGGGSKVLQQLPKGGSVLPTSQTIYLITEKSVDSVPDLTGMSLRDALEMCSLMGASCQTEGEGYVASQTSSKTNGQLTVKLTLAPPGEKVDTADDSGSGADSGGKDGDTGSSGDEESTDANKPDQTQSDQTQSTGD
ncbi:penicillin-binding transpeptidase domain-containing protein [Cohnella zeiphila]|uniref:PASTA domain-containing protein n=1 Tax=Cohnella zeiphila TaxID=2761120 RepID=A0A7X0VTA2_9BACL|nr:penicillin-binding transpeptidase domain-containing protein [Cohnella zeiphila]MBB6729654.1 PASTA domain-containing protein [Cohnella zeiphila]